MFYFLLFLYIYTSCVAAALLIAHEPFWGDLGLMPTLWNKALVVYAFPWNYGIWLVAALCTGQPVVLTDPFVETWRFLWKGEPLR